MISDHKPYFIVEPPGTRTGVAKSIELSNLDTDRRRDRAGDPCFPRTVSCNGGKMFYFHSQSSNPFGRTRDVVAMYGMLEQALAKSEPWQAPTLDRKCMKVATLFGRGYQIHVAMSLISVVLGQINTEVITRTFWKACRYQFPLA